MVRDPEDRSPLNLSGLALETEASGQNRPMFCGPSWVGHSCVPLRFPHRSASSRVALEKTDSSGASSRLAPLPLPKELRHCLPAEIGSLALPHPSCRCRLPGEAGTAVPITWSPCTCRPSRKSEKCGEKPVDNGDIGSNRWNLSQPPARRPIRLLFRSPLPTSFKCLNHQPSSPIRHISRV